MRRFLSLALLSLLHSHAAAFEDTSPFILAVSHPVQPNPLHGVSSPITISADHFQTLARQTVSQCSSQLYVLVHQPGLHVTDFTANAVPYLRKVVKNADAKITADYGHGKVDLEDISLLAADKCLAKITHVDARRISHEAEQKVMADATFPVFDATSETRVLLIEYGELPEGPARRKAHLSDNDAFLLSIMTSFPNSPNYTLIYTSSPSSHVKSRNPAAVILPQDTAANSTMSNKEGLFQRYQFFTPAVYMGLMAMVVLVPVLLIAVAVVSSLKISPFEAPRMTVVKKTQ